MTLTIDGYPLEARDNTTHPRQTLGERIQHHIDTGRGNLAFRIDVRTGTPETHAIMRQSEPDCNYYYWLCEDGAFSKRYGSPGSAQRAAEEDMRRLGNDPS
jgi:hypothetical protein